MILSLHHPSFTVEDIERSVAFYRDVLGLTLEGIWERDPAYSEGVTGVPGARLKVAYFTLPNASFELVEYTGGKGVKIDTSTNNTGSAHVCFIADDFDALADRLKEAGAVFPGGVNVIPGGSNKGKKIVYVEDPDNNTLEIISSEVSV
ncbi:VOC family protein [Aminivibrio sp.]|jgi:catechol 2,3-dioxygenase-like lactoylglutathione lyase family enzyme|uniref:VOC family protein n=1 Tax=Aminivibrio sp. TaxID=1872489 RepID=UPI001A600EAC|nr:VOC family protein [Aminivibrio sp.]MBL3539898.1 VOC family protein [Aminivibrio sp.]MDK2958544.1 lactoylglutathione lyase [Synergistaceae bacterium]